ncbi:MAG: hypothetical protein ABIL69_08775 [candidate division WOR-3 bacterium]
MKNVLVAMTMMAAYLFGTATIYDVELSFNDNFDAREARQTFLATADSISEVSFFCGRKIIPGYYIFTVEELDGTLLGETHSDSAGLYDYELVSAEFNPKVPVRKGFTYQLHIKHSRSDLYSTNFYYNRSNPYPDGELIGHPGCDLAARIVGINNFPKDLFGMNSGMTVTPNQQPQRFWYKEMWKSGIDSMKAMGVTWDRTGFCAWQHFQWENKTPQDTIYKWGWCDTLMRYYAEDTINVLWCFSNSTRWASCCDSIDTLIYGVRGHEWYKGFPKNLFKSVLLPNGFINHENYFARYVYKFVKRYGPNGDFWRENQNLFYLPIKYYEIWNEPEWLLGLDSSGIQIRHRWCNDSIFDPYYDSLILVDNSPYKKNSLIKVYTRMCIVADSAIKKAVSDNYASPDSVFTIFYVPHYGTTNLITTPEWLAGLSTNGLGNFCKGASIHSYATPQSIPYFHQRQKQTLDSVWYYLRHYGFGDKFLLCTEHSTGCFDASYDSIGIAFPVQTDEQLATFTTFIANDNPAGPLGNAFLWAFSTRWTPDIDWEGKLWALTRLDLSKRPPGYGFKQLTNFFKHNRFNKCLTLSVAYDTLRIYEFENLQTNRRIYVGWKEWGISGDSIVCKLPLRTNAGVVQKVAYNANPQSYIRSADSRGYVSIALDTVPKFIYEPIDSVLRRPDLVIDSVWTEPPYPRHGDSLRVFALLRNIDALQATTDTVFVHFYNNDTLFATVILKSAIRPNKSLIVFSNGVFLIKKGLHILKVIVNKDKNFIEHNFLNNSYYLTLSVPY